MMRRIIVWGLIAGLAYFAYSKFEQWRQTQLQHQYIAEGLMIGSAAKTRIVEYYLEEGKWPGSNEQLKLDPPDQLFGLSLRSVEIIENGVIRLSYDEKSGVDGGQILLLPQAGERQLAVRWECWTASYTDIAGWAPQCVYEAP